MKLYSAEKVADFTSKESAQNCRLCGERMKPLRAFVDDSTGETTQILECECGERDWRD